MNTKENSQACNWSDHLEQRYAKLLLKKAAGFLTEKEESTELLSLQKLRASGIPGTFRTEGNYPKQFADAISDVLVSTKNYRTFFNI